MGLLEQSLLKLYEQAKREQWNSSALPWEQIDREKIPDDVAAQLAWLAAQLLRGELASLRGASQLVGLLPEVSAKLVASIQVADEARHIEWFGTLLGRLEEQVSVDKPMEEFLQEIEAASTTEEILVGLQILEVVAHVLLLELGRKLQEGGPPGTATPLPLLGSWLQGLLARDEGRHAAFGQLYLTEYLRGASEDARCRAAKRAHVLCTFLEERAAPYLRDEFGALGADGPGLLLQGGRELRERLRRAGLQGALPVS